MLTKVIMPQLGESVVEGTVSKWLKREGETTKEFEPLIEVTTDKVDTEIPSPATGTLLKIYVTEGTTVRAGTLLAYVGQAGESLPEGVPAVAPQPAHAARVAPSPLPSATQDLGFISPVVAKIAAEHGVDLAQVKGTGQGGRVTKKDVLAFVEGRGAIPTAEIPAWEQPGYGELFRPTEEVFGLAKTAAPTPAPGTAIPLSNIRKSIAEHMVRSKHTSPHVTSVMEVDMSRVVAHREAQKAIFARDGVNLTFTAYFVVASVAALKQYPIVNSSWGADKILLKKEINIGVAAAIDEGLIVPVIKDADRKSLLKIAAELNDLAQRARNKQLKPDEVAGGTFTITNHGVAGSLFATPIINQPQCAILGVGVIEKRVKVIDDAIAIRPMVYLSLTFDHRILDGAIADYFLAKVKEALEKWR
ncbi:MAG: 2-oxo acid dehydrogenase subunit E2 [Chloroflexi bacterium]|nr:2-oxo acid dehydrogenase subunit E2 [Chloroflexota bacterium]